MANQSKAQVAEKKRRYLYYFERSLNSQESATYAGIRWHTLYAWRDRDPEFKKAHNKLKRRLVGALESTVFEHAMQDGDLAYKVLGKKNLREYGTIHERDWQRNKDEEGKIHKNLHPDIRPVLEARIDLIKGARKGLDIDTLAHYAAVDPEELKQTLKDGMSKQNADSRQLTTQNLSLIHI